MKVYVKIIKTFWDKVYFFFRKLRVRLYLGLDKIPFSEIEFHGDNICVSYYQEDPVQFYRGTSHVEIWYNKKFKIHREDGPAIVYHRGVEWYLDGVRMDQEKFFESTSKEGQMKLLWEMDQWK